MELQRKLQKSCKYRGLKKNKNLIDNFNQCSNPFYKCYDIDTNQCTDFDGNPIPQCPEGIPDRVACAARWPEYPCYTRRKTCVSTDGIELFDPIDNFIQLCRGGIDSACTRIRSFLTKDDINTISQDPELQTYIYDSLSQYGPDSFLQNNHIVNKLQTPRKLNTDIYVEKYVEPYIEPYVEAYLNSQSRQNQFNTSARKTRAHKRSKMQRKSPARKRSKTQRKSPARKRSKSRAHKRSKMQRKTRAHKRSKMQRKSPVRKRSKTSEFLFNPNNPDKSFDVYIDKNPKDTISIKYTTYQDVVKTIKKLEKLYKSKKYDHKRISQVAMIIRVRLRALKQMKNKHYNLAKRYVKFLKERTKLKTFNERAKLKFAIK
jgi:hypothetical protein